MTETLMVWLRVISRLVLMQIMVAALTLLGLVLLGAAPAAAAAARVAGSVRRDEDLPLVRTMWNTWRGQLKAANLAAAPAAILAVAATGNLLLLGGGIRVPGPLGGLLAPVAVLILLLAALIWLVSVILISDGSATPGQALRAAVLFPVAFPGTALSAGVTLAGVALVGALAPVLAVLCGASLTILLTEQIVSARRSLLQEHLLGA